MQDCCYDPVGITGPKTFYIQSIAIPFTLKDSCRFLVYTREKISPNHFSTAGCQGCQIIANYADPPKMPR